MASANCPSDELLLPMLGGEAVDPAVSEHLGTCRECLRRLQKMRAEVNWVRGSTHAMEVIPADIHTDTPPLNEQF